MRHLILKDKYISKSELDKWIKQDTKFFEDNCGFTNEYVVIEQDYYDYPTYIDSDGDIRPTVTYLHELVKPLESLHGKWAFEHIMVMIHEYNWKSDPTGKGGIWGTNYSYTLSNGHVQYCRWDKNNVANSFGTAYHERAHAFDALIHTEIGLNVNPLINVVNYDQEMVHGRSPKYKYIRYQENKEILPIIAPYIKRAVNARKQKHLDDLKKRVILWKRILQLSRELRKLQNRKNGVPS